MKIVSVINIKGGVGKTTLTANLGAYAASQGKRVLMIDLDSQASLTFSFIDPEYWRVKYAETMTIKNFFESIIKYSEEIPSLSSLAIPINFGNMFLSGNETLYLVSSHLDIMNIDMYLASSVNVQADLIRASTYLKTYSHIKRALKNEDGNYDLVLVDCPPSFGASVMNAIAASDYYIIPAKLDYLSSLGVNSLNNYIDSFMKEYNRLTDVLQDSRYTHINAGVLGIVPMMVNIQKGDEMIDAQEEYLREFSGKGYHIFQFVRNNGTLFGPSPKEGIPAVLTRPKFFTPTARKIVRELQTLGSEFLSLTGI